MFLQLLFFWLNSLAYHQLRRNEFTLSFLETNSIYTILPVIYFLLNYLVGLDC